MPVEEPVLAETQRLVVAPYPTLIGSSENLADDEREDTSEGEPEPDYEQDYEQEEPSVGERAVDSHDAGFITMIIFKITIYLMYKWYKQTYLHK